MRRGTGRRDDEKCIILRCNTSHRNHEFIQLLQNQFAQNDDVAPGGLYRRQIDRAVAAYRDETGLVRVDQNAQLIAPEVAQIAMRCFDGEQWVEEWDSEEYGGFPPAVEVTLVIDPARTKDGANYRFSGYDPETMQFYRTVIHLPAAELEERE